MSIVCLHIFFCSWLMSQLKVVYYNLFFVHINMSYYWFNGQKLLQKVKHRYQNCSGKEKLLNIISQIKGKNKLYYWFKTENILKNAWDKYHNKGGGKSFIGVILLIRERENTRNMCKNLSE